LCDKKKKTALHIAAQQENIQFVSTLSSGNVLINSADSEGMTALHRAVLSNKKNSAPLSRSL
jgi:ankyrin repeat protein